jgi:hypothetical protein
VVVEISDFTPEAMVLPPFFRLSPVTLLTVFEIPLAEAKITMLSESIIVKNLFVFIFLCFCARRIVFGLLILVCINDGIGFKKLQCFGLFFICLNVLSLKRYKDKFTCQVRKV